MAGTGRVLNDNFRAQISQGYTAMVLFMITMTLTWFLTGLAKGSMQQMLTAGDGVESTVRGYTLFFSFDILMAFLVRIVDHRWFRWIVLLGSIAWTGYFSYLVWIAEFTGYVAAGWHMVAMGSIRNLIGIYVCYAAFRWALSGARNELRPVAS